MNNSMSRALSKAWQEYVSIPRPSLVYSLSYNDFKAGYEAACAAIQTTDSKLNYARAEAERQRNRTVPRKYLADLIIELCDEIERLGGGTTDKVIDGTYRLQNRYQDGHWEELHIGFDDLDTASEQAYIMSQKSPIYGMVQVVNENGDSLVVYPAGG